MKYLTFLLLMLVGCAVKPAEDPTLVMHGDVHYTDWERKCVQDAADQWKLQTQGVAEIGIVWDYNSMDPASIKHYGKAHRIVRWTSTTPVLVEFEKERTEECIEEGGSPQECAYVLLGQVTPGGGIHAATNYVPVEMRLVADRLHEDRTCRVAALHEFGHVLGIPHLPSSKNNIMYPSVNTEQSTCLTGEDLLVFCWKNDCGNVQMKACGEF